MKIFHTADLHLGSKMLVFSEAEAKERREELLLTFSAIISRALSEKAEAVIIAGDLFDGAYPSITLREEVRSLFFVGGGAEVHTHFGKSRRKNTSQFYKFVAR